VSPTAQYLVETVVTLVAVVAVSVVVLWAARRLGVGAPQGPLALLGRLPLDQKRAVYLVRVGSQVLVVGGSEGGLVKLGELAPEEVPSPTQPPSFREVLARVQGRAKMDKETDESNASLEGREGSEGARS
jgi:flagellar protein FliO/FliZ